MTAEGLGWSYSGQDPIRHVRPSVCMSSQDEAIVSRNQNSDDVTGERVALLVRRGSGPQGRDRGGPDTLVEFKGDGPSIEDHTEHEPVIEPLGQGP